MAGLSDFITSKNINSPAADIGIKDLYTYLKNPEAHIKKIRSASAYLTNKHGILKDVLRMTKSLPTLKYSLFWSNYDNNKRNQKSERKINDFLDQINVTKLVRDGLYEVAKFGTVITCLRKDSYVQFLDYNEVAIHKQRNGKWVVEFDLQTLSNYTNMQDKLNKIESLPDEVNLSLYNKYRNSNDKEKDRYVELSDCDVINIDAERNSPWGLPMTLGSWLPILQKEVINNVERSVSSRLMKQILVLSASWLDKEQTKPVPADILRTYFNEVGKLVQKKDSSTRNKDDNGTGLIALPHFLNLEALKIDTTLFKEELYSKLDNDIYQNLGISPSLIAGLDGNYASANVNNQKFYSFIFTILEQFESVINGYIEKKVPKDKRCKLVFDRSTVLDKDTEIERYKELYEQIGVVKPWIESLFGGGSLEAVVNQAKHEKEDLEIDKWFKPPLNPHTSSSKVGGENKEEVEPTNDNTGKTRDSDGNNTPSPVDE